MARTATARIKFVETTRHGLVSCVMREYNVEVRQGQVRRTIGRIYGGGRSWEALPVAASAWTRRHTTRAAAVQALQAREDFRFEHTFILA
jgi:hypothetical protein